MPSTTETQVARAFQAMEAGDWIGARDGFSAAIELEEVAEARFGLAMTMFWLGDAAGAIDNCERAYLGFVQRPEPMMAAGAALSLVGYYKQFFGNAAAARGWLAKAARIIEEEVPELQGELFGATAYVTDDPIESEALARRAFDVGRANGNADLQLLAMTAVGNALVQQGRIDEGLSLLDEVMVGAVAGEGVPLTVAQASCMTMVVCGSCFDMERATQWLQALERFIDRYGCPFLYAECRTYYGRVLFETGDWEGAVSVLTEAIALSNDVYPSTHAFACGTLAELQLAQGRREDAARTLAGLEGRDEAATAFALLHLARDEPSSAAAVALRRLEADGGAGAKRLEAAALIEALGTAHIALDRRAEATERGRALVALGSINDCRLIVAHGQRLVGLATASSDPPAAQAQLEAALAGFAQLGLPYRAASTRLALAHLLERTDPQVAGTEARVAFTVFEDLGAGRDADDAAALLRRLGVRAARTGPKNLGRLTKREQEVVELLGEGLSNPEIAARLFLSRKTVEHHVARILSKLGFQRRAEVAALVGRSAS